MNTLMTRFTAQWIHTKLQTQRLVCPGNHLLGLPDRTFAHVCLQLWSPGMSRQCVISAFWSLGS